MTAMVRIDDEVVDVSDSGDANMTYVAGQGNPKISITIVGGSSLGFGDTSTTCSIAWNDSTSVTFGKALISSKKTSGSKNGAITTTLEIVPCA